MAFPELDIVIEADGQQLILGDTRLTFYLAPGHSSDGMFTVVEPQGVFLAGDYLSNVEFPFIYDSSSAYLKTMEKVELLLNRHDIKRAVPGHGSVTDDIMEIKRRVQKLINYIMTLRDSIRSDSEDKGEAIIGKYTFVKGLRAEHQANIEKIRSELAVQK